MSYVTKVRRVDGGDQLEVADGGSVNVLSGGSLTLQSGAELNVVGGGQVTDDGIQASAVGDLEITYTAGDPSITADGALTVANGGTPTVDELLEFCEELKAQTNAILAALRGVGVIAS